MLSKGVVQILIKQKSIDTYLYSQNSVNYVQVINYKDLIYKNPIATINTN